jgi:hypothetical protein
VYVAPICTWYRSASARAAWGGFIRAATELATLGRFDGFAGTAPHAQLQKLFAATDD